MESENALLKLLLVLVAVVVLLPVLMMALMMPMMGLWGWGHMDGGMGGAMGGTWMWLLMLLLPLAAVVAVGYLLYRVARDSTTDDDPALEELRVAYARGELSEEEFEERRQQLRREE